MNNDIKKRRTHAMSTEKAREVKLAGHEAEREFANLIGGQIYPGTRKKDVIDSQNNIHSVKSGQKKWQIFLYGENRFRTSIGFLGAPYFLTCINSFPKNIKQYKINKTIFKKKLQTPMENLKKFLLAKEKNLFLHNNQLIFLQEAIFHSSEVDYLTIKEESIFHIFDAEEVIKIINNSVTLENSKANQTGQLNNQKVIFKLISSHNTIGEIEMRNDSKVHYRQIKFWMDRKKTLQLLKEKIKPAKKKSNRIVTYGKSIKKFKI